MIRQLRCSRWLESAIVVTTGSLVAAATLVLAAGETTNTVDSAGRMSTSLALDAAGFPVISYHDDAADLKVVHCNDAVCGGGDESIRIVDSSGAFATLSTSLVLDASGFPVIAHRDAMKPDLRLVHCNDVDCDGDDESVRIVDSAAHVLSDVSLVLDADGFPVISYHDLATADVKLAHCNDAACGGGDESIRTVDSFNLPSPAAGLVFDTSLVLDAAGFPVISYTQPLDLTLKLVHCNDAACDGGDESIRTLDVGRFTSLALDSSGFPVISYFDELNTHGVKLMHCNDAACDGGDDSIRVVDSGILGGFTSLALDTSGFPVISYQGGFNNGLKLVHCNDAACDGGNDSIRTVDFAPNSGEYTSLALDTSGFPVISYLDELNPRNLRLARCDDAGCSPDNDGDGVPDAADNCSSVSNSDQTDLDADANGDACDADDDGDGALDMNDAFPLDRTETVDSDSDGTGDNADLDDDGDGQNDTVTTLPPTGASSPGTAISALLLLAIGAALVLVSRRRPSHR